MNPVNRAHLPAPEIAPAAEELLSGSVRKGFDALMEVLERQTQRDGISVVRVDVDRFFDPEDASTELVLALHVSLGPAEALAYWDRLGDALEEQIRGLSEDERRVANREIAVQVVAVGE